MRHCASGPSSLCDSDSELLRLDSESPEVPDYSFPSSQVSGHHVEYREQPCLVAPRVDKISLPAVAIPPLSSDMVSEVCPVSYRLFKLRCLCNSSGAPASPKDSACASKIVSPQSSSSSSNSPSRSSGNQMVVGKPGSVCSSPSSYQKDLRVNRCVQLGMGGDDFGGSPQSEMDQGARVMAHKPQGTVWGSSCNPAKPGPFNQSFLDSPIRQSDGLCLYQEAGGASLCFSPPRDREASQSLPFPQHHHKAILHSGCFKHPGGQVIPPVQSPRLASQTLDYLKDISEVGNTGNRPVRFKQVEGNSQLCVNSSRRCSRGLHRCLFSSLEFQPRLGLPSPSSDSPGSSLPEPGVGLLPTGGSQMEEGVLEGGLEGPGLSASLGHSESSCSSGRPVNELSPSLSGRAGFRSLEDTGWSRLVEGWTDQDKALLLAAWRPSTRATYSRPWTRWTSWASSNSIDPFSPSPQDLARFLAFLHSSEHLALPTIHLHKSVVVTLSDPSRSSFLSSHPLVSRMLKAVAASRPPKQTRFVWEVSTLLNWISSHPPNELSFFELSRHLALLLLLSSGRRVHDLTLLHCDPSHLQVEEDFVLLWPGFGSKTDSSSFRQSGWRFSASQSLIWNVPHWLRVFLRARGARCGNVNINALFISTLRQVRPASRSIIAGWVNTALEAAGISAPAGSVRSAVNSSLARANLPLDVILARGNWRSSDTFLKHYYRPTPSQPSNSLVAVPLVLPFEPVS
uniref:Tyr recombinase domain-containing protein n=1 Tax=Cacopsylla melanoneura TaxID=428564 RepID=A0A8D8SSL0_9HEMI